MPRITLTASDGFTLNAYRAEPSGKPRGGVVLYGEVWGLNNWVRSVADRWAAHGFLTIAPAMFDRVELGYESDDYGSRSVERHDLPDLQPGDGAARHAGGGGGGDARAARWASPAIASAAPIRGARRRRWTASRRPRAIMAAAFPTTSRSSRASPPRCISARRDQGIPMEQVEQLKEQHPTVDIYTYDADHGFCNSDRPDRFDEAACTQGERADRWRFFTSIWGRRAACPLPPLRGPPRSGSQPHSRWR